MKDKVIKHMKASDFTTDTTKNNEEVKKILNGAFVPDSDTLMSLDEIKNQLNDKYGVASLIDDRISVYTLEPSYIVDNRILITGISGEKNEIQFFDLRTYKAYSMSPDAFNDFVRNKDIKLHNYTKIKDSLFNNTNTNITRNELNNIIDDKMKAIIENVCQEAAKKFTENFIDEMMMIKEQEDY